MDKGIIRERHPHKRIRIYILILLSVLNLDVNSNEWFVTIHGLEKNRNIGYNGIDKN